MESIPQFVFASRNPIILLTQLILLTHVRIAFSVSTLTIHHHTPHNRFTALFLGPAG